MRIAYTVMGYGRGHAMRTAAVLPALEQRHTVRVFAGRDAHEVLATEHDSVEIPVIGYQYGANGRICPRRTLTRNAPVVADLLAAGPRTRAVWQQMADFAPDVVISDSETYGHRFARHHDIPRIGFDHVGIMAYCHCRFAAGDRLAGLRDGLGYRMFMGDPDRVLVSSFYPAAPRRDSVQVVGPILRDPVRQARPSTGDYLLVYLNKGDHQYTAALDTALRACGERTLVYGTSRRGDSSNLCFKAPSQQGFIDDLAGARAVISTAGNQLLSEAIHLGKPVLALPEDAVEQRLNAQAVVDMGVGQSAALHRLSLTVLGDFLEHCPAYAAATAAHRADGLADAIQSLNTSIARLARGRIQQPGRIARLTGAY
ncbi:glycosyltransferase family protein [Salinisphaera aquimarina]|uniref:Glycosyltransferase family protein n=1 Tax=Salinisphaera aquimarina TaxID=2094031 RepID=A0ABV7EMV3_9GAMM